MKKNFNRNFILVANTSKYLLHYRSLLIKKLNLIYEKLYVIAPLDNSSFELNKLVIYKSWYLPNKNQLNPFNTIKSLFILFKSIKKINPFLVHSHTLKPNFLISILNFFLGVNTIISFPGMGRLSNSKGFKNKFFKLILKIIYFSSIYQLNYNFFLKKNFNRVRFIFQNPIDLNFFLKTMDIEFNQKLFFLIPGSGFPDNYLKSVKYFSNDKKFKFDFIYCARLEKSKGINLFISLADYYPESIFYVYGSLDKSSEDYLSQEEIETCRNKNKNLKFMDYVENPLLRHHNDNSILLVPSYYGEGLPRAILEAMSLEIPIVASKKACVGLFDNRNLFMSSDNKIESYISNIEKIFRKKNQGELNQFLTNSKEHVIKKYSESLIVEKTLDLYRSFD